MERKFLSVQELSARWGLSYPAVREVIQSGKLPAARLGGRRYRVEIADVEAYETAAKAHVGGAVL